MADIRGQIMIKFITTSHFSPCIYILDVELTVMRIQMPKLFGHLYIHLLKNAVFVIQFVTGPAKIDHVSANYTELYFH